MITLHEEIVKILQEKGNPLTTKEISESVNERKNYRKRDGSCVTDFQVHGRTNNYLDLFERQGTIVKLKSHNISNELIEIEANSKNNHISETVGENDDDVSSINYLMKTGFINIGTIDCVSKNGLPNIEGLKSCGLYAITKPENYKVKFLPFEVTLSRNNVVSPWSQDVLESKWVEDSDILYCGIAGAQSQRSLKKRLGDLIKHCKGKTTGKGPHKGGEIIWQLDGYESFTLWIFPMDFSQRPRKIEESLLKKFFKDKGQLPFANRKF